MQLQEYLSDFISLFYPNLCNACKEHLKKGESVVCLSCQYHLPKTDFHLEKENPVYKIFWGRVPVEAATSFYYFNKGNKVQNLLHQLKYRGQQDVGRKIGEWIGLELKHIPGFQETDIVIPVPLHITKQRQRGYNQSHSIAEGLSEKLGIPWKKDLLKRTRVNPSQTRKRRYERWENVRGLFKVVNDKPLKNKHVLLVDDVITTGSTLEACAIEILKVPGTKVSVVTLAYAQH